MTLDEKYGKVRNPTEIRLWEDRPPVSLTALDEKIGMVLANMVKWSEHALLRYVAQSTNYLWVMDPSATVWLAVEELAGRNQDANWVGLPLLRRVKHPADTKKLGHPTLVGGGPARIAGELSIDTHAGGLRWNLNAQSGRYCRMSQPARTQLDNVGRLFQSFGVDVYVDHY